MFSKGIVFKNGTTLQEV